jgi:hypothetical protein
MNNRKLCDRCKGLTLDDLEQGYLLYTLVAGLAEEAKRDNACTFCTLIWWSLRYDHSSILRTNIASVRLFLNPPPQHGGGKLHRIDIVVTEKDSSEFGWGFRDSGEPWHLGPPDGRDDIFRGHLNLYGSFGEHFATFCNQISSLIIFRRSIGRILPLSHHQCRF